MLSAGIPGAWFKGNEMISKKEKMKRAKWYARFIKRHMQVIAKELTKGNFPPKALTDELHCDMEAFEYWLKAAQEMAD